MKNTKQIKIDTLEFDCRYAGNETDELVIFLHGFPETSFMWKKLLPEIAALGFYCIAPNMRGYSPNACPKGRKNYTIPKLSKDILDIAEACGSTQFHLVGHDWGAALGWNIAYQNKDKILSWSALSVPHTQAFMEALKGNRDQRKKSRYIQMFQLPLIPEIAIRKKDFDIFRKLWQHSSDEEVQDYLSVFRRKESLTAALHYYRANIGMLVKTEIGDIEVPTLFIWGKNDEAIGAFSVEKGHQYIKGDYTFLESDGGHWLIQTKYDEVKTAIIEQLTKYKTT